MLLHERSALGGSRAVLALALVGLALTARIQGCKSSPGLRPGLVWDGSAWVTAWGSPDEGGVDVYVHRFELRGGGVAVAGLAGDPQRVIRLDGLRSPPELASGPGGFLLLLHRKDRAVLAMALDAAGAATGSGRSVARGATTLCAAPGWTGDSYAAAWVTGGADGRARLELALFDRAGQVTRSRGISVDKGGTCALAVAEGRVALLYTRAGKSSIHITGEEGLVEVAHGGGTVRRLIPTADGWAVLLSSGKGLRVVELDRHGRTVRGRAIDGAVNADSADLGGNQRGLFLTWTDSRRAYLAGFDGDGRLTSTWKARGGRGLSVSRALGHAGSCAVAWTSLEGLAVHVAVAGQCPLSW